MDMEARSRSKAYELIRSFDAEQRRGIKWWLSGKQAELLPFFSSFLWHIDREADAGKPDAAADGWQRSIWAHAYGSGAKAFTPAAFNTRQSRLLDELLEYLVWHQLTKNPVRKRLLLIEYLAGSPVEAQFAREIRELELLLGDPLEGGAMQPGTEAPLDPQSYQGRYELAKWKRQGLIADGHLLRDRLPEIGAVFYVVELLFFACFQIHKRAVAQRNGAPAEKPPFELNLANIRALFTEPYFDTLRREHRLVGWLAGLLYWLEQPADAEASEQEVRELVSLRDTMLELMKHRLISLPTAQNLLTLCRWHCKQRYNVTQAFPYIQLTWRMFRDAREHGLMHTGGAIPEPSLYAMLNTWRAYKAFAGVDEAEVQAFLSGPQVSDTVGKYFSIHLAFDAGKFDQALAYIREVQSSTGWPHAALEFNAGSVGLKAAWELHKPARKQIGHPDPEHFRLEVNRLMTYVHNHQAELASYHKDFLHAFRALASLRTHAVPGFRERLAAWELRPDDKMWFVAQAAWLETA